MKTSLILAAFFFASVVLIWILSRPRKKAKWDEQSSSRHGPELLRSVVHSSERFADPYPYVFVDSDGTARELHAKERDYLETPFRSTDVGQPYIKGSYAQNNGWGEIRGFLHRSDLPATVLVAQAPISDPHQVAEPSDRFLQFPKTNAALATDEDDADAVRRSRG